jgi:hypothetical protein
MRCECISRHDGAQYRRSAEISDLLSDCTFEFLWLIARCDREVFIHWTGPGARGAFTHHTYQITDWDELRKLLSGLNRDRAFITFRCGNSERMPLPFDEFTPPDILRGFRDGLCALPRYWHQ